TGRFAPVAPVARPARSLAGARVLVVDDSPAARRLVSRWLERWGAVPTAAGGLREAHQLLDEAARAGRPYHLVLVDGPLAELASLPSGAPVEALQKPVEEDALHESVLRALEHRALEAGSRRGRPGPRRIVPAENEARDPELVERVLARRRAPMVAGGGVR